LKAEQKKIQLGKLNNWAEDLKEKKGWFLKNP
jgi:hypothetical protein